MLSPVRRGSFLPDLTEKANASERYDQQPPPGDGGDSQSLALGLSSSFNLYSGYADSAALGGARFQLDAASAELLRQRQTIAQVIGVLTAKGQSAFGTDQDDIILAPSTTVLYRLGDGKTVRSIVASAITPETMETVKEEISVLLRQTHRIPAGGLDNFNIHDQTEINQMATRVNGTLTLLLSAIGARPLDILAQFLVEAATLSLLGGLIGIACGLGTAWGIGALLGISVVINPLVIAVAVLFTGAVGIFFGIFFGFYPARKAANLNPIDALRYE